jgi:hypothetical protein
MYSLFFNFANALEIPFYDPTLQEETHSALPLFLYRQRQCVEQWY